MTRPVADVPIVRVQGELAREGRDKVVVEAPLEIRLGGKRSTVLMRTPGHDEELVRGFLFTEGLVDGMQQIEALERPAGLAADEVGNVIAVRLAPGAAPPPLERAFVTSASCGVCGKATIAQLVVRAPRRDSTLEVAVELLEALPGRLRAAQPIFAETGGLHAAGLFDGAGELVCAREDIGRHNAVDKVVGWALERGQLPLVERVLVVSGRAGYEILQKAIAAGVPIVGAVGAPSSLAVELAEEFGVTLAGFLRGGACNIYTNAARVLPLD